MRIIMALLAIIFCLICLLLENGNLFPLDDFDRDVLTTATKSFDALLKDGKDISPPIIITLDFPTVGKNWKPAWKSYYRHSYILFDPLSQFSFIFENEPLCCSLCHRKANEGSRNNLRQTQIWKDGTTTRRNPRIVYDINSIVFLVSKVYKCRNGHSEVPATDPDILKRIPSCYLPFILKHRSGLTSRCVDWVEEKINAGISINMAQALIKKNYRRDICQKEERFWTDYLCAKKMGITLENNIEIPSYKSLYQENEHYMPTRKLITDIVVANFMRSETTLNKLFSSTTATWISCDHTFKTAANIGYKRKSDGKWISQYKAIFCILNELGQVLQWQLTAREGFEEVRAMFMDLKKRFDESGVKLSGIFIDNCCKWRDCLSSIFNNVPVKLDLFHATQRVIREVPKRSPVSKEFGKYFGLIFRQTNDIGNERTKSTPQPAIILKNIDKFIYKWKNVKHSDATNVLSKTVMSEINNLKRHIKKGCLSGIGVGCSTSRDERLHREMNKIVSSNRLGVQLAHVRLSRLFMDENKKRDSNNWPSVSELSVIAAKEMFEENTKESSECQPTVSDDNQGEEFGIRSKRNKMESFDNSEISPESRPIKYFTIENLDELQRHVKRQVEIASKIGKSDEEDNVNDTDHLKSLLLEILKQALAWWAASLSIQTVLGDRCINKKNIPSMVRSRMNCKTNAKLSAVNGPDEEVERIANLWGYSIVQIPKDGDCLFKSVAFQLFQLLSNSNDRPSELETQLNDISLNMESGNVADVAARLRALVVDEWQGEFREDYLDFFSDGLVDDSMFTQEAEKYREQGTFAGSLGDSMPLALANILHLPIMILSTEHVVPFIDICPRNIMTGATPIFLAHYSAGGGHYNALIRDETVHQDHDEQSAISFSSSTSKTEANINYMLSCRCKASERKIYGKYRERCDCVNKVGWCQLSCKCDGKCGDSICKPIEQKKNEKKKRKSQKRVGHEFQRFSPQKGKDFLSTREEHVNKGSLNLAEHFILRAVVNYLLMKKEPNMQSLVGKMYNEVIQLIMNDQVLVKLPVSTYENSRLKRETRKLLLQDDKLDNLA